MAIFACARPGWAYGECYATGSPPYSPTQTVQLVIRIAAAGPGASAETLGAEAGTAVGVRWPADWAARRE